MVYLATHVHLEREVAIKVLAPELSQDRTFRERLLRESKAAAALHHPHIVPVYDGGEVDGLLYLAMRYVDGSDLSALIDREGPLDPMRVSAIVGQIASALDAARRVGLVHRDVKPGNILVSSGRDSEPRDHCYLCDFGVTKLPKGHTNLTMVGQVVGTTGYMAPEQIQGGEVDGRADIYSLGCIVYEATTGKLPFERDTPAATLWAHVNDVAIPPTHLRAQLPSQVDEVVGKAMAKSPADRYSTAGELAAALAASPRTRPVTASGLEPRDLKRDTVPDTPPPLLVEPPQRREMTRWIVPLVAVVALLVAVAALLLRPRDNGVTAADHEATSTAPLTPTTGSPPTATATTIAAALAPTTSPPTTVALTTVPTAPVPTTTLNVAQAELVKERVPNSIRDTCAPGTDPDPQNVTVTCQAENVGLQYTLFASAETMNARLDQARAAKGVTGENMCHNMQWPSFHHYHHHDSNAEEGHLLCFTDESGASMHWTSDEQFVYTAAHRADGNQQALYAEWALDTYGPTHGPGAPPLMRAE